MSAQITGQRLTDQRQARFATYDAQRNFGDKAYKSLCYAPHTTLYFDIAGNARVCCHNHSFPAGNILHQSIDEIWHGARIKALRQSLEQYEFGKGCDFCAMQAADNWFANMSMRRFDDYPIAPGVPEWPQQMEFSISNACNLECIMCAGIWSSAIRARREKLPKLPHLYSREFMLSLRKYLPHLKRIKFLGGEPFLVKEYYLIWDMLIEDKLTPDCHVTTNGTQLGPRVKRLLEALPFSIAVSLDGTTKQTVERIRVNTDYDTQIRHVKYFGAYAKERGTSFSLTFCLMRQNWHEFGDYCAFGDELDCSVWVNTVRHPPEFGIYTMELADLREVVRGMEFEAPRLEGRLGRNRNVWFAEFERLRRRCASLAAQQAA